MVKMMNIADTIEENGKTVRENNLSKEHDLPIGTLVEAKAMTLLDDGASIKYHARLFVAEHTRDCDGTPLYTLARKPFPTKSRIDNSPLYTILNSIHPEYLKLFLCSPIEGGFCRDDLTPIKVTSAVRNYEDGGIPDWDELDYAESK